MVQIREYRETDRAAAEALMAELQDHEHPLEPDHRPISGPKVIPPYVDYLLQEMGQHEGRIFIAEDEEGIAGLICVMIKRSTFAIETGFECHGYVTDLCVSAKRRGGGIGKSLLYAAEEYASLKGAKRMKLTALARNPGALRFYDREGYRQYEVMHVKKL